MAMAIVVPVLANGFRAFGTIYAAHLSTADAAAGFDHVVYGWFFFAFVMALVMGIGWRFFDRAISDPWLAGFAPSSAKSNLPRELVTGLAFIILVLPFIWLTAIAASGNIPMKNPIILPQIAGWSQTVGTGTPWSPHYGGADHLIVGHYANAHGDKVDLAVALYASQREGRELIGYGQGPEGAGEFWSWSSNANAPRGGKAERLVAPGPINREVMSFYLVNGKLTGSSTDVKIETMKTRLLGKDQAAGVIMISAVDQDGRPARAAIDVFLKDLGAPEKVVTALIVSARGQ